MLNISENSSNSKLDLEKFKSGQLVIHRTHYTKINRVLGVFVVVLIIFMFLPWTQNISGKGKVTTLRPDQKPQTIQSPIPGRIEEWFIKEGDFFAAGDTLMRISEVKSDYFDDELLKRTKDQINMKSNAVETYNSKVDILRTRIEALTKERALKINQAKNKRSQIYLMATTDSLNWEMGKTNLEIIKTQYNRVKELNAEGLKSTKDVEAKRLKLQETETKLEVYKNKFFASKNKRTNADIEISRLITSYQDKLSKAQSDLYSAQTSGYDAEVQLSKLNTSYSNYSKREGYRYIKATQAGYVNKIYKSGIGETIKAGEKLILIMPKDYELVVETYVRPIDLPLIHIGEKVSVQFDGWPAIVFSGWPNVSYGTYGAEVIAIDNYISSNGKYRILLSPDKNADHPWPDAIRIGSGARTMALLEEVPVGYEIWRQLNSFPPNFYQPDNNMKSDSKSTYEK